MQLILKRFMSDDKGTIGTFHIDNEPKCFTMEDAYHETKIYGKTRIPMGNYEVKLRDAGGMTQRYAKRYSNHKGMLWLQNVPNFEWVYIHTGNTDEDTDGCILLGEVANLNINNKMVQESRDAYVPIYEMISGAILNGIKVNILVIDE
ncbi:MAG: hypothetical protein GQ570_11700 [Helicobacteraceae bacterium]|nr:hypothetical protein [Helicobacteraceae bacterium]